MEWWYFVVVMFQSALQSIFLVCYFHTDHRFRKWLAMMLLFMVILFPVNEFLFEDDVLIRNLINMGALFLACAVLFRTESWKSLLAGIILYELLLVSSVVISICTGFLIFRTPPNVTETDAYTIFMYFYGSIVLMFLIPVVLRIFSRSLTPSDKMNSFLYSLLINIILMGIIWSMTALPGYSRIYPVHYVSISLLIILISLYTVYSLIRFINTESKVQAQT